MLNAYVEIDIQTQRAKQKKRITSAGERILFTAYFSNICSACYSLHQGAFSALFFHVEAFRIVPSLLSERTLRCNCWHDQMD